MEAVCRLRAVGGQCRCGVRAIHLLSRRRQLPAVLLRDFRPLACDQHYRRAR